MIRLLPYAIEFALVVFCLIDCVQADERRVRNLPKWAWIVLIILIPIVGCVVWLFAGRPTRASAGGGVAWPTKTAGSPEYERPRQRPKAPDDDPEFLRSLKKANTEHENMLRKWEEDLKRREEERRKNEVAKDEITKDEIPRNEVPRNGVPKNEVTKDEVPRNGVPKNEVTKDEVPIDDVRTDEVRKDEDTKPE